MIYSLGIYPDLFDRGAVSLQTSLCVLGLVTYRSETGPVGSCAIGCEDKWSALIERQDGAYHVAHKTASEEYSWHQEGTYEELQPWALVWASVHPTELRELGGKKLKTPRPNELVAFDNHLVEHRRSATPCCGDWARGARNRLLISGVRPSSSNEGGTGA